jgi:hypothetical protein
MKRLISCTAKETAALNKEEKLQAIQASEGRVIISEMIPSLDQGTLKEASVGELYASVGADILLLNQFDVFHPYIRNMPCEKPEDAIRTLKKLTGRLIGINLEPVSDEEEAFVNKTVCSGRKASRESIQAVADLGADMILLTGNPGTGVDNEGLLRGVRMAKKTVGDRLMIAAGRMHSSGRLKEAGSHITSTEIIEQLIESGADIVLLPAPGTVPGITMEQVRDMVERAHASGALTITSIGTSQEDADLSTIREIALLSKMTGTDMHHIGDGGLNSCVPESIMAYSIAIRGRRHTYNRMASSPLR